MNDIAIQKSVQPQTGPTHDGTPTRPSNPGSFGKMMTDSIDQVNRLQVAADSNINDLALGKRTDIHRTMVAIEKASISFELLMQIRNKVISAYDRIMRMPI